MKIETTILVGSLLLLLSTQHSPAPIQETPESPTPAPTVAPTAKPSSKPQAKSEASESPARQQTRSKQNRFAGKWIGTMPEIPWGNVPTELIIDRAGTTMTWQESGKQKGTARAQLVGETLQAHFEVGVPEIWSITVQPDGATAQVRLQAVMNDQTAIFRRSR